MEAKDINETRKLFRMLEYIEDHAESFCGKEVPKLSLKALGSLKESQHCTERLKAVKEALQSFCDLDDRTSLTKAMLQDQRKALKMKFKTAMETMNAAVSNSDFSAVSSTSQEINIINNDMQTVEADLAKLIEEEKDAELKLFDRSIVHGMLPQVSVTKMQSTAARSIEKEPRIDGKDEGARSECETDGVVSKLHHLTKSRKTDTRNNRETTVTHAKDPEANPSRPSHKMENQTNEMYSVSSFDDLHDLLLRGVKEDTVSKLVLLDSKGCFPCRRRDTEWARDQGIHNAMVSHTRRLDVRDVVVVNVYPMSFEKCKSTVRLFKKLMARLHESRVTPLSLQVYGSDVLIIFLFYQENGIGFIANVFICLDLQHWVTMNIGYCDKHPNGCGSFWDPMNSVRDVSRATRNKRSYQQVLLTAVSSHTGIPMEAMRAVSFKSQGHGDWYMCGWRTVNYATKKTSELVDRTKELSERLKSTCTHNPPNMSPQIDLSNRTRGGARKNLEFIRDYRQVYDHHQHILHNYCFVTVYCVDNHLYLHLCNRSQPFSE